MPFSAIVNVSPLTCEARLAAVSVVVDWTETVPAVERLAVETTFVVSVPRAAVPVMLV